MRFEYYHGTSNLFLKSIKENGLGAINPTFDNQTLELLKYLYGICENSLFSCSEYDISTRETILAMIKQTSLITKVNGNVTKFNFRHKNIYVSLSEFKAVIYASTNKYGSEVLQQCVKLYELLIKHNVSFEIPSEINFYNIQNIEKKSLKPILVKITHIDDDNLIKENDFTSASEFLCALRENYHLLDEKQKYSNFQYMNFEILNPISPNFLEFYEIDFMGNLKDKNLNYKLKRML